jgi:hypothetical protein
LCNEIEPQANFGDASSEIIWVVKLSGSGHRRLISYARKTTQAASFNQKQNPLLLKKHLCKWKRYHTMLGVDLSADSQKTLVADTP